MKRDRPSKGNPHRLTIRQHIHSARCIEKFAEDGRVYVYLKDPGKLFTAKPTESPFWVHRVWDQKTEHGFMKKIEDAFHSELDHILETGFVNEHEVVSAYLALWRTRSVVSLEPPEDSKLEDVIPTVLVSKEGSELLEKNGISTIMGNIIESRFMAASLIRDHTSLHLSKLQGVRWSVMTLGEQDGELIVPDMSTYPWFPIAPRIMLCPIQPGERFTSRANGSSSASTDVNALSYQTAVRWVFARSREALEATMRNCGVEP